MESGQLFWDGPKWKDGPKNEMEGVTNICH